MLSRFYDAVSAFFQPTQQENVRDRYRAEQQAFADYMHEIDMQYNPKGDAEKRAIQHMTERSPRVNRANS